MICNPLNVMDKIWRKVSFYVSLRSPRRLTWNETLRALDDKNLTLSKLKAFADDKINVK